MPKSHNPIFWGTKSHQPPNSETHNLKNSLAFLWLKSSQICVCVYMFVCVYVYTYLCVINENIRGKWIWKYSKGSKKACRICIQQMKRYHQYFFFKYMESMRIIAIILLHYWDFSIILTESSVFLFHSSNTININIR